MWGRSLGLLLMLVLPGLGAAWYHGLLQIPDRWNPWAPLTVTDEPNLLTRYKLRRLAADESLCLAVLATAPARYQPVPDRETAPGCGFRNAVRLDAVGNMKAGKAVLLSCPAAVALALWERHVVQPAAERHFGTAVVQLEHYGSYACRNLYGRAEGRRSQHATADALDVAGFVLGGGQGLRFRVHWEQEGRAGVFLREVHRGACGFFDGVLGPEYNAAHRDHLHLERGATRICR